MNTFEIAKDAWQALGAGKIVANPAAWKKHQVSVNQVAAAIGTLLVLAKAFGYDLHMDNQTELYIAGGAYGVINWLLTVITTDKIGVMGQRAVPVAVARVDGAAGGSLASGQGSLDSQLGSKPAVAAAPDPMRVKLQPKDPSEELPMGG